MSTRGNPPSPMAADVTFRLPPVRQAGNLLNCLPSIEELTLSNILIEKSFRFIRQNYRLSIYFSTY